MAAGFASTAATSPASTRRRAAVVGIARSFQIPHPFSGMTVFENLVAAAAFGGGMSERAAYRNAAGLLEMTGLARKANALAGALTLLERKRLEMARALATGPDLLLLDEIAGGLTEAECNELVTSIRALRGGGVAIIWIEHVVHALLAVVDRLVVLDFGRADGGDRPRPDVQSAPPALRRDQPRPRAPRDPRYLCRLGAHQAGGHQHRHRRAGHRPGHAGRLPTSIASRKGGCRCAATPPS